jgi:phosphoribosyl-ATP pyrophosphohydrolase
MADSRLFLRISNDEISANSFFNYLIFILMFSDLFSKKYEDLDEETLAKERALVFDTAFHNLTSLFILANYLNIRTSQETVSEAKELGNITGEIESFINTLKLNNLGIEIDRDFLTRVSSYMIEVTKSIEKIIEDTKVLSYDTLEKLYNESKPKPPMLSFIYAFIPKDTDKRLVKDLEESILVKDVDYLKKKYKDFKLYSYKDIDLLDYYITDEEFGSEEMYELYEILERIGIYEDTIGNVYDIELNKIIRKRDKEENSHIYVFKDIREINKKFDQKLYEYYRGLLFDEIFDETHDKLLEEASDSINVLLFEEPAKEIRKISQKIFDRYVEYLRELSTSQVKR